MKTNQLKALIISTLLAGIASLPSYGQNIDINDPLSEIPYADKEQTIKASKLWQGKIADYINSCNPNNLWISQNISDYERMSIDELRLTIYRSTHLEAVVQQPEVLNLYEQRSKELNDDTNLKIASLFKIYYSNNNDTIARIQQYAESENWLVAMYALSLKATYTYANIGTDSLQNKLFALSLYVPPPNHPNYAEAKYIESQDLFVTHVFNNDLDKAYNTALDIKYWAQEAGFKAHEITTALNLIQLYFFYYGSEGALKLNQTVIDKAYNYTKIQTFAKVLQARYLNVAQKYNDSIDLLNNADMESSDQYVITTKQREIAYAYAMIGDYKLAKQMLNDPLTQGQTPDKTYNYIPIIYATKTIIENQTKENSLSPQEVAKFIRVLEVYRRNRYRLGNLNHANNIIEKNAIIKSNARQYQSTNDNVTKQKLSQKDSDILKGLLKTIPAAEEFTSTTQQAIYEYIDKLNGVSNKQYSNLIYSASDSVLETASTYLNKDVNEYKIYYEQEDLIEEPYVPQIADLLSRDNNRLNPFLNIVQLHNLWRSKNYDKIPDLILDIERMNTQGREQEINIRYDLSNIKYKMSAVKKDLPSTIQHIDNHVKLAIETQRGINKNQIITTIVILLMENENYATAKSFVDLIDTSHNGIIHRKLLNAKIANKQKNYRAAISFIEETTKNNEIKDVNLKNNIFVQLLISYSGLNLSEEALTIQHRLAASIEQLSSAQVKSIYEADINYANYLFAKSNNSEETKVLYNKWRESESTKIAEQLNLYEIISKAESYAIQKQLTLTQSDNLAMTKRVKLSNSLNKILATIALIFLSIITGMIFTFIKRKNQMKKDIMTAEDTNMEIQSSTKAMEQTIRDKNSRIQDGIKVLEQTIQDSRSVAHINTIKKSLQDMESSMKQQLILMKLKTNAPLDLSIPVNIHHFKKGVLNKWRNKLEQFDIEFKFDIDPRTPLFQTDISYLDMALDEIYSNSKSRTLYGQITTKVEHKKDKKLDQIRIKITDSGSNKNFTRSNYNLAVIAITRLGGDIVLRTNSSGEKIVDLHIPIKVLNGVIQKPHNDSNIIAIKG